jgi:hypothetical protein
MKNHHNHARSHRFSGVWDNLGIVASTLCLIDCIVLPIASTILLSIQSIVPWAANIHVWLLLIIGITASMAFYHSYEAHRAFGVVATGAAGLLLLIAGEFLEAHQLLKGVNWVSPLGSILLITAHLKNLWMHRGRAGHQHHNEH